MPRPLAIRHSSRIERCDEQGDAGSHRIAERPPSTTTPKSRMNVGIRQHWLLQEGPPTKKNIRMVEE